MQLLPDVVGKIGEDLWIYFQPGTLHLVEQRRERQLNFRIDRFEVLFENPVVKDMRRLRSQISGDNGLAGSAELRFDHPVKAEAVRQGCLAAFASQPRYVGYWDADLAPPLDLVADFQAILDERFPSLS